MLAATRVSMENYINPLSSQKPCPSAVRPHLVQHVSRAADCTRLACPIEGYPTSKGDLNCFHARHIKFRLLSFGENHLASHLTGRGASRPILLPSHSLLGSCPTSTSYALRKNIEQRSLWSLNAVVHEAGGESVRETFSTTTIVPEVAESEVAGDISNGHALFDSEEQDRAFFLSSTSRQLGDQSIDQPRRGVAAEGGFSFWQKLVSKGQLVLLAFFLPGFALVAYFLLSFLNSQPRRYRAKIRFPEACGVTVGTSVRIRDVEVGTVVALNPSLQGVNAVVEVRDEATVIPKSASFVANKSGLVGEPLVDILPSRPLGPFSHGPRDVEGCRREGKIVCEGDQIEGVAGVDVDKLTGLWIKLGRASEEERAKRWPKSSS